MVTVIALARMCPDDVPDLVEFLARADLTLSGLDDPDVRLWLLRDSSGQVHGSAGYELSSDERHALIRSVAVEEHLRGHGTGLELAGWALQHAAAEGARHAWLFSRRSGPFWQRLGFTAADRDELAEVLSNTRQVSLFRESGQLQREVAWARPLDHDASSYSSATTTEVR